MWLLLNFKLRFAYLERFSRVPPFFHQVLLSPPSKFIHFAIHWVEKEERERKKKKKVSKPIRKKMLRYVCTWNILLNLRNWVVSSAKEGTDPGILAHSRALMPTGRNRLVLSLGYGELLRFRVSYHIRKCINQQQVFSYLLKIENF